MRDLLNTKTIPTTDAGPDFAESVLFCLGKHPEVYCVLQAPRTQTSTKRKNLKP